MLEPYLRNDVPTRRTPCSYNERLLINVIFAIDQND